MIPTQTGPSAFQQISFNPSHDINPTVMSDGRILYTRWSHTRLQVTNGMHLYTINPDGTNDQLLYGAHSHFVGTADPATGLPTAVQFVKARRDAGWARHGDHPHRSTPAPISAAIWSSWMSQNSVECFQRTLAAGPVVARQPTPARPMSSATTNDVRTIPGPVARRAVQFRLSAVGRHWPDTGELGGVPLAQSRRQ